MGDAFLDLARQGRRSWRSYLLAIVLIVFGWIVLGTIVGIVAFVVYGILLSGDPSVGLLAGASEPASLDPLLEFITANLATVMLLVSTILVVRFIHRRPIRSLITTRDKVDWRRIGLGMGFWMLLVATACLVEAAIYPGRYRLALDIGEFLRFLPFVLLLTPLQTTAEEVLFRGYLLQGIGLVTRRLLMPAVLTSALFMLVHFGNPEMTVSPVPMALNYLSYGLLAALVTLRDNRMELALGIHAGNNIFSWLGVSYAETPLSTPAVFTTELDPYYGLASFLAIAVIFYLGIFHLKREAPAHSHHPSQ